MLEDKLSELEVKLDGLKSATSACHNSTNSSLPQPPQLGVLPTPVAGLHALPPQVHSGIEAGMPPRVPHPMAQQPEPVVALSPGLLQLGLHLVTIKACNLLQLTLQVVTIKACSLLQRTLHLVILKLAFPP